MPPKEASRTLIVTPTYNERENLPRFLSEVRSAAPNAHILIVNDNSPDGTGALADGFAAKDDHVRVMHRAGKLGLGTAYVQAFEKGIAEGYDYFFEMDADLFHDSKYLPAFMRALESGADVVIGSRNIRERPEAPVFSYTTFIDAGDVDDPSGESGLAHMFEHLAFKGTSQIGTTDYPDEKIALAKVEAANDAYEAEYLKPVGRDEKKLADLKQAFLDAQKEAEKYVIEEMPLDRVPRAP